MIYPVPEDFQRKLDDFNASQGGPSYVAVCWHPGKERWQVFAVPQDHGSHPLARRDITIKLCRPFPDGSSRRGVLLFTWCRRDNHNRDLGFEPLDDRIFHTLHWADSFRSRRHFEETIEEPEMVANAIRNKELRDIAGAAAEYWHGIDRLVVGPGTSGDWRGKAWWR